jgi:uncharacterized damage-inducible protein DinB
MIIQQLNLSHGLLKMMGADLTEEEAAKSPDGKLSPIIWNYGHAVGGDNMFLTAAGGESVVPETFWKAFPQIGGSGKFPPLAEALRHLDATQAALVKLAQTADLAMPVEPPPYAKLYTNVGELLIFSVAHRQYHAGKIMTLRSMLSKARLLG